MGPLTGLSSIALGRILAINIGAGLALIAAATGLPLVEVPVAYLMSIGSLSAFPDIAPVPSILLFLSATLSAILAGQLTMKLALRPLRA